MPNFMKRLTLAARRLVDQYGLRLMALALIALVAGPEFLLSAELIVLLDLMGAELFLLSFGGAQLIYYRERIRDRIESAIGRVDPFFFIPTREQLRCLPGIVAHAIPFFVLVAVSGVVGAVKESLDI